jgi:hypothetical protein
VKAGDSSESGGGWFRGVSGAKDKTEDAPSSSSSGFADCADGAEEERAGSTETEKSGWETSASLSLGRRASVLGE